VLHPGLALLLRAYDYAQESGCSPWVFAVNRAALQALDLTCVDLHWLASQGYVQYADGPAAGGGRESASPNGKSAPGEHLRVVLTDAGAAIARKCLLPDVNGVHGVPGVNGLSANHATAPLNGAQLSEDLAPHWDATRRELWVGPDLVKRYRQPAPSQERILTAFEEEGWPSRIDDPLPPQDGRDPKYNLHNTISNLNRNQRQQRLHFSGDGRGEGVTWQLIP
jgi:hypothetical protein